MNTIIYDINYFYSKILKTNLHLQPSIINLLVKEEGVYNKFSIQVNGKNREITSLKKESELYRLQRNLLDNFFCDIPVPDNVCGFVKGKGYLDFLKEHCGKKYYLRLDIENFFKTIKIETISGVLKEYIQTPDSKDNDQIISSICNIVTYERRLPQGAVTSPQVSNIVFRRLDIRIRNYCRKFDIEYTRYADDILFSSDSEFLHKDSFYKMIYKILSTLNFKINKKKTLKSEGKLILNGYVISDKIRLSRKKLSTVNAFIFYFENYNGRKKYPTNFNEYLQRFIGNTDPKINQIITSQNNWIETINYLSGYRSYLINFSKERYNGVCFDYSNKVKKIELILEKIVSFKN